MSTNLPARVGVVAALDAGDQAVMEDRARNASVRDFTRKFFHDRGYQDTDSQTNFILVDIGRSGAEFQSACRERGVRISRGSGLLPNHTRISMGTQDEMERATRSSPTSSHRERNAGPVPPATA